MGAESRRGEPAGIEPELRKHRVVERIEPPAYLEGGDVLQVDRKLLVGVSLRTNLAGLSALEAIVRRYGYAVTPIPVARCLHLKTACSALPDGALLINPAWIDAAAFPGFDLLHVGKMEPWAANILSIGDRVCCQTSHPRTADLIRQRGFEVELIDLSEFAKAEGGISCLNIVLA